MRSDFVATSVDSPERCGRLCSHSGLPTKDKTELLVRQSVQPNKRSQCGEHVGALVSFNRAPPTCCKCSSALFTSEDRRENRSSEKGKQALSLVSWFQLIVTLASISSATLVFIQMRPCATVCTVFQTAWRGQQQKSPCFFLALISAHLSWGDRSSWWRVASCSQWWRASRWRWQSERNWSWFSGCASLLRERKYKERQFDH